jgi:hypothetical protein
MIKYLRRTWKNKAVALAFSGLGYLTIWIDYDATAFVFILILSIPLFFARENLID